MEGLPPPAVVLLTKLHVCSDHGNLFWAGKGVQSMTCQDAGLEACHVILTSPARAMHTNLDGYDDYKEDHGEYKTKEIVEVSLPHGSHGKVQLNENVAKDQ